MWTGLRSVARKADQDVSPEKAKALATFHQDKADYHTKMAVSHTATMSSDGSDANDKLRQARAVAAHTSAASANQTAADLLKAENPTGTQFGKQATYASSDADYATTNAMYPSSSPSYYGDCY